MPTQNFPLWWVIICIFFRLLHRKGVKIMPTKREVALISFFASIFYAVNAKTSLDRWGYIANRTN